MRLTSSGTYAHMTHSPSSGSKINTTTVAFALLLPVTVALGYEYYDLLQKSAKNNVDAVFDRAEQKARTADWMRKVEILKQELDETKTPNARKTMRRSH